MKTIVCYQSLTFFVDSYLTSLYIYIFFLIVENIKKNLPFFIPYVYVKIRY